MKKCEIERPWLLPILSNKILLLLQLAPIGEKNGTHREQFVIFSWEISFLNCDQQVLGKSVEDM